MVLILTADHLAILANHAQQAYPEECCGLLLGDRQVMHPGAAADHFVCQVFPTANVWQSHTSRNDEFVASATTRYAMDSAVVQQADAYARRNDWDIIGIYHSHPDHPAMPSQWDRQWAWPQYSYLIISVEKGTARDYQSWQFNEHHDVCSEQLIISAPAAPQVVRDY